MNGQYPQIAETKWNIPENRKQHIIVLLGEMIAHSLTETNNSEGTSIRKGREHPVVMKHAAVESKSSLGVKDSGVAPVVSVF